MIRHISRNFGKEAGLTPVAFTRLQVMLLCPEDAQLSFKRSCKVCFAGSFLVSIQAL